MSTVHKCLKAYELQEQQKVKLTSTSIAALEASLQEVHLSYCPSSTDYENRRSLVDVIDALVKEIYGNMDGFPLVEAFGSFVMDMFTSDSDLDLSINFSSSKTCLFSRDKKIGILKQFLKALYANQRKGNLYHVQPILRAKVPIIKFIDRNTGIECDISVENKDGVTKSFIISLISLIDERFQILCCLIKMWAKAHEINSSKDHTLNSLSIILLVAIHLQTQDPPILPPLSAVLKGRANRGELQDIFRQFKDFGRANKETIAELFVSLFCKLLSVETLWEQGICASAYEGSWIFKKWDSDGGIISVEDFTDRSQNCARAVKKDEFKMIYRCIRDTIGHISLLTKDQNEVLCLKELLFRRVALHIPKQPVESIEDASHKGKYLFTEQPATGSNLLKLPTKKKNKARKKKEPSKNRTAKESDPINIKSKRPVEDETATEAHPTIRMKKTNYKTRQLSNNQPSTQQDPIIPSKMLVHMHRDRGRSFNESGKSHIPITPIRSLPVNLSRSNQVHGNVSAHNFALLPSIEAYRYQGQPSLPNDVFVNKQNRIPLMQQNPRLPFLQSCNPGLQQQLQFPHTPSEQYTAEFQRSSQSSYPRAAAHGYAQGLQQSSQSHRRYMPGLQESSWTSYLSSERMYLPPGQSYMPGFQQSQMNHLTNGQNHVAQLQRQPQIPPRPDDRFQSFRRL